jgi:glycosyltransferase involved in cell wall biosynthesis
MAHVLLIEGFSRALIYFRPPLIRALQQSGHTVTVATELEPEDGVVDAMAQMGVECAHLPIARNRIRPVRDLLLMWRMRRLMRRIKPDVLMTWTIKPNIYGPIAARLAGVSRIGVVVCGLGRLLLGKGPKTRLGWWLLRLGVRRADKIFVQNPDDQRSLELHRVTAACKRSILTAGCGVDLDAFPVAPLPERPVVLMLGRLLASKGVNEFLEAAAIVRQQRPDITFELAGLLETGNDAVSDARIQEAVEQGDIVYLGFLKDQDLVREAIRRSCLYALPSWHEGTPHSTLEAMSTGRPIVTTDTRGCRETVRDGVNGLLVPVRDAQRLADAILKVLADQGRHEAMAAESRRMAEEIFDASEVAQLIMNEMQL